MRWTWIPVLALAACGGTGATVDAEGCMYLAAGPYVAVTAASTMDSAAPPIEAAAAAYTVTLPAGNTGFVAFDSPDDTEYALFTDHDVDIAAFTTGGTEVPRAALATSSSQCATIKRRYIIELAIAPFFFKLDQAVAEPFQLVVRPYNPD